MPNTFAVIDAGSNALRLQIASVDQPGTYKIIEQDRQSVRLGHKVFSTGMLDPSSREEALETFRKFKAMIERHGVTTVRAVATSAMREAKDRPSFIREAKKIGVNLEVLSEEDEARLISFGIRSGLKFDPIVGLFMDIGGGSVEISVSDRTRTRCLFSLPLGAVRMTEQFIKHDPPREKEIVALQRLALQRLSDSAKRIARENFTMAFGSGGTMTALADTDARLAGDVHRDSLYVLRKGRLQSLFHLLRSQHLKERSDAIVGDPKRADILVAGAAVLLAMMDKLEIEYVFVSRRGLRDGLMVDLLATNHPAYVGPWIEETGKSESLEEVGQKYNFDAAHSQQVSQIAVNMFQQLRGLHKLPDRYSEILRAAAVLHDIGLFVAYPKHHKHSYYLIKSSGPSSFDPAELDLIANIARYHRKGYPSPKHVPFQQLSLTQQDVVRKLAAILRVADALDYGHQARVERVKCSVSKSRGLTIRLIGEGDLTDELDSARNKAGLMKKVYGLETSFK